MMNVVQFTADEKKIEFAQVPIPKITQPNDVLIKVEYSGICGTDLHILEGKYPCITGRPLILGHEFSGTVEDTGEKVNFLRQGDKVVVDPNQSCECCTFCHSGNPHFCTGTNRNLGTFVNGGWSEYVVVPEQIVHKLPDTISLKQGALAEPLSCVSHGCDIISPVSVGSKILITGAGIIGSLWVCTLHLQGHRRVTVSDPNTARLNTLEKLGTGYVFITPDQLKKNGNSDPKYLFDIVIDCSGHPAAIEQAVSLLQSGGKFCCFGVAPPNAEIKLKPFDIFMKELQIFGVKVNPYSFTKSIGLLEAMGDKYLGYENLGIQIFALKDYEKALQAMSNGTVLKAVFKI